MNREVLILIKKKKVANKYERSMYAVPSSFTKCRDYDLHQPYQPPQVLMSK